MWISGFHTGVHERPLEGLEVETLASLDSSNRFEALKTLPHRGFPLPQTPMATYSSTETQNTSVTGVATCELLQDRDFCV